MDDLIPKLQTELENFKAKLKSDSSIRVENKAGYKGGGSLGWLDLAMLGLLAALFALRRARP